MLFPESEGRRYGDLANRAYKTFISDLAGLTQEGKRCGEDGNDESIKEVHDESESLKWYVV